MSAPNIEGSTPNLKGSADLENINSNLPNASQPTDSKMQLKSTADASDAPSAPSAPSAPQVAPTTAPSASNAPPINPSNLPSESKPTNNSAPEVHSDQPSSTTQTSDSDSSDDHSQDSSFLSQQGRAVRDAPRKRRRTTPHELEVLEAEFQRNNRPGKSDRERIAKLTSMDEKAVQVWFQNKRQSHRRLHNHITPAAVRTQSLPIFQDENSFPSTSTPPTLVYPAFIPAPQPQAYTQKFSNLGVMYPPTQQQQQKQSKSLKLSMSADGKAELIERSPLKPLNTNTIPAQPQTSFGFILPPPTHLASPVPASRFNTMPLCQPNISGIEQECVSSLMELKSGKW